MKIEPIGTPRLWLRGFEKDDAEFAFSVWNDREMGQYLPDPVLETLDDDYRAQLEALGDDDACCYMISVSRETGERIGTCSFIPSPDGAAWDIAYCVHRRFWGQGYATEMVRGMIDLARSCSANRITVDVNRENGASNAVVRKLNFRVVGERSYKKRGTDLTFTDYHYERTLEDWPV